MVGRIGRLPRCQVPGCRRRVGQVVEIELPMAWEASAEYTVLTVAVGACRPHGHDLARRTRALLEARAEFPNLLHIIDGAVIAERELRQQIGQRDLELGAVEVEIETVVDRLVDTAAVMRASRRDRQQGGCRAS